MEDDDLSANTNYLRSRSEIWKKSATNQKRSSVAIKLQIMLQYFNQYISKHTTFTLKVNTQFTVCVTLFTVLLVHGEQLVYLPCKLGNH